MKEKERKDVCWHKALFYVERAIEKENSESQKAAIFWGRAGKFFHLAGIFYLSALCNERAAFLSSSVERARWNLLMAAWDYSKSQDFKRAGICWEKLAKLDEDQREFELAARHFARAGANYFKAKLYLEAGQARERAGEICFELGMVERGLRHLTLAGKNYFRAGNYQKSGECALRVAKIQILKGEKKKALRSLQLAWQDFKRISNKEGMRECLELITRLFKKKK